MLPHHSSKGWALMTIRLYPFNLFSGRIRMFLSAHTHTHTHILIKINKSIIEEYLSDPCSRKTPFSVYVSGAREMTVNSWGHMLWESSIFTCSLHQAMIWGGGWKTSHIYADDKIVLAAPCSEVSFGIS